MTTFLVNYLPWDFVDQTKELHIKVPVPGKME